MPQAIMRVGIHAQIWVCKATLCAVIAILSTPITVGSDSASMPTSEKFGFVGDFLKLEETCGFPNSVDFFESYVFKSKPLIMRGAAKTSPAFNRWKDDDYFLNQEIPEDEYLTVETTKKENRTQKIMQLNFRQFLETYKDDEKYMVDRVPEYLRHDVILPRPLQCPHIYLNSIVEAIMWFSAGGTKSVVHTDSVDNMNCVYSGEKQFIMIDPKKYADKVLFDHPEGAYSDIDVDNVDYDKYPGLLSVQYYHVHLKPGDCFFIPYKWIHQVRSDGPRNIAINIWWDTHRNRDFDLAECSATYDPDITVNKIEFISIDEVMQSASAIRDHHLDLTRHSTRTLEQYISYKVLPEYFPYVRNTKGYTIPLLQIFKIIDTNQDGIMTHAEVKQVEDQDWERILEQLDRFHAIIEALHRRYTEEHDLNEENDHGLSASHDEL